MAQTKMTVINQRKMTHLKRALMRKLYMMSAWVNLALSIEKQVTRRVAKRGAFFKR